MTEDAIIRAMTAIHTGGYPKDGLAKAKSAELEKAFTLTVEANAVLAKSLMERLAITDKRAIPTIATFPAISRYLAQNGGRFPTIAEEAKGTCLSPDSNRLGRIPRNQLKLKSTPT